MKNLYKVLLCCFVIAPITVSVGVSHSHKSFVSTTATISTDQLKDLFNKQVKKNNEKQELSNKIPDNKTESNSKIENNNIVSDILKKLTGKNDSTVNQKTPATINNNTNADLLPKIVQQGGFANIIGTVSPAVVSIVTIQEVEQQFPSILDDFFNGSPFDFFGFDDFFGGYQKKKPRRSQKAIGAASGFCVSIVNNKLYIATNYHVVEDAKTVAIFFNNQNNPATGGISIDKDKLITAKIHGVDPKSDLAVLEVDMNDKNIKGTNIQTIKWGSSDKAQIGDYVIAIGNPFGIGISVSQGIVSAKGRQLIGESKSSMENYIQHTAALNRGNSGGVLINMNGEVIGVNNAIYSPNGGNVGVGFAIPSDTAKSVIDSLVQHKRTFRGWLGATIQGIKTREALNMGILPSTVANIENLPPYFGVLVNEVSDDGPAAKAGVKAGDIIVLFDGQLIDEANKLPKLVNNHKIKEPATLTIVRRDSASGALNQIEVQVDIGDYQDFENSNKKRNSNAGASRPANETVPIKISGLDIFVSDETDSDKKQKVVVRKVKKQKELGNEVFGNIFEFANPFEIGDIIEIANSTQITSATQLKNIVSAFQSEHPGDSMTFKVLRRSGNRVSPVIITITINKADPNAKPDDDQYEEDNQTKMFRKESDEPDDTTRNKGNRYREFRFSW